MKLFHRWRAQFLMTGIILMGLYLLLRRGRHHHLREEAQEEIDMHDIEKQIEARTVGFVTYQPAKEDSNAWVKADTAANAGTNNADKEEADLQRTLKFHRIWGYADKVVNMHELFSDTPDVEGVLTALATARIVHVDKLDEDLYTSGTGEKWVVTLEGGAKAMMKIDWGEEKGTMKRDGHCNFGHEQYWAEIAAFHLHKVIGFRNTPYVSGRKVDLKKEIFPVATPAVAKSFSFRGKETCVTGTCFHCEMPKAICPKDGIVEASVAYWVQHRLQLYTFAPKYMPYSTPNVEEWQKYGFNNKTYCNKLRQKEPYTVDRYYHDLFDFAVVDFLMYHYDSKHYIIDEKSPARGLTVRLDHGRAFCAHDHDLEHVFLAPLKQCCTLRRDTYWSLKMMRPNQLADKLRLQLARDPIAPVLDEVWYNTLERRKEKIIAQADKCADALGGIQNILVG